MNNISNLLSETAKKYGISFVLLCLVVWGLWLQNLGLRADLRLYEARLDVCSEHQVRRLEAMNDRTNHVAQEQNRVTGEQNQVMKKLIELLEKERKK